MSDHFPLDLADRCVKCGLCLPHCPTYQLTQNEAESPRGRIALMQGLATGLLEPSNQLQNHLDQCLSCRSCEVVCPAEVPYGELIDAGRHLMSEKGNGPVSGKLPALFINPVLRRLMTIVLWSAGRMGFIWLVRHLPLPAASGRLAEYLPRIDSIKRPVSRKPVEPRGQVALFTGCVSESLDLITLQDSCDALAACGFEVHIPQGQGCCGALYQHSGEKEKALALAKNNIAVFSGAYDAIIGSASGCTAMLKEYSQITGKHEPLSEPVTDIGQFLEDHWPEKLGLEPLKGKVAIHDPCTLRNALKQAPAVYRLLERIPEIDLVSLTDNATCCGAAGDYFLNHPELSDKLGTRKQQAIRELMPDIIVTSNIGCAMQLRVQVNRLGLDIPVMHPVSLIRQQLKK